ncbi:hypothetical protein MKX01_013600 [Papaver californicum]|nr:hypothetical protein MKX01_013600 [Papaver californicum]
MSLSPNDKYKQRSGKILSSKTLQEEGANNDHDDRPCKISRTLSYITNLPGDCLDFIFKCLETKDDRNSFGLTCHQWLHIQNNKHESLWCRNSYKPDKHPKISRKNLAIITCRLLIRFQHLKKLCLGDLPTRITDVDTLKSQSFGSNVQRLYLNNCSYYCPDYSDMQLSLIFSWFPRLTYISLDNSNIADNGLEALAKCCSSLTEVDLSKCCAFTDSRISFLLQNCRKLSSLTINYCSNITGMGFLGCAQTLTCLEARGCELKSEGFRAIVSGGGLEQLYLLHSIYYEPDENEKGCVNTEAVMTISKGCSLLKELSLSSQLEVLAVMGCQQLCDRGLQAIWDGCNKLYEFGIDGEKNSCSSFGLELFMRKKPGVVDLLP